MSVRVSTARTHPEVVAGVDDVDAEHELGALGEGPEVHDQPDVAVRRDPTTGGKGLEEPQLAREPGAGRLDLDLDVVAGREQLAAEDRRRRRGLRLPEQQRRDHDDAGEHGPPR